MPTTNLLALALALASALVACQSAPSTLPVPPPVAPTAPRSLEVRRQAMQAALDEFEATPDARPRLTPVLEALLAEDQTFPAADRMSATERFFLAWQAGMQRVLEQNESLANPDLFAAEASLRGLDVGLRTKFAWRIRLALGDFATAFAATEVYPPVPTDPELGIADKVELLEVRVLASRGDPISLGESLLSGELDPDLRGVTLSYLALARLKRGDKGLALRHLDEVLRLASRLTEWRWSFDTLGQPFDGPEAWERCAHDWYAQIRVRTPPGKTTPAERLAAPARALASCLGPVVLHGTQAPADVAAAPADAQRTASGLATRVIQAGTGTEKPGPDDTVTVHHRAWTADGTIFENTFALGDPKQLRLSELSPGFSEAVQLMVKGETRRAWIPESLAMRRFGPQGTLVFEIELIDLVAAPKPIPVPDDVASVPKSAKVEKSGLASRVLKAGAGTRKPTATSMVEVHYTGWTTDGKRFDSSVMRGEPAQFPLNGVIAGWTEGLQLMVEGERRRFWIPGKLAYGEKPAAGSAADGGPPLGTLVFDVELLRILP